MQRCVPLLWVLISALVALMTPLKAHVIERNTSFMRLDLKADAIAIVHVLEPFGAERGAELALLEVIRDTPDAALASVTKLVTLDRFRGVDETGYSKGVTFAFLRREKKGFSTVLGTYLATPRKYDEYTADQKVNFLGSLVSAAHARSAVREHIRIEPRHAAMLPASAERKSVPEKSGEDPVPPFAHERMAIYREWLASENPLLAISALVDAYDTAEEAQALLPGTLARVLDDAVVAELQSIAVAGLAYANQHVQSAALAVLERIGVPKAACVHLRAICRLGSGKHLQIVRQEAYRYLGTAPGLEMEDLKTLVEGYQDATLQDALNDYVSEGIQSAARDPRNANLLTLIASSRLGSPEREIRISGLRALAAVGTPAAYERLFFTLESEQDPAARRVVRNALRQWPDPRNIEALAALLDADQGERWLGSVASDALDTLVAIGSDAARGVMRRCLERRAAANNGAEDAQMLAALVRVGDLAAFDRLLRMAAGDDFRAMRFACESLDFLLGAKGLAGSSAPSLNAEAYARMLATVREASDGYLREQLGRITLEARQASTAQLVLAAVPEVRDTDDIHFCALVLCAAPDAAAWHARLVTFLASSRHEEQRLAMRLCATFPVASAKATLLALGPYQNVHHEYERIHALAVLDDKAGSALFARFYATIAIEEVLLPGLDDSFFSGPECAPLLSRLIDAIVVKDNPLAASQATLLLSHLTGRYDGFRSDLGLDPVAAREAQRRWREWYGQHVDSLAWNKEKRRFTWR